MHTCIIIPSRLLTWQLFDITNAINSLVFLINRSVLETETSGRAMGHLMNGYVDSSAGPFSGHALQDVEHSLTFLWFQHVSTPSTIIRNHQPNPPWSVEPSARRMGLLSCDTSLAGSCLSSTHASARNRASSSETVAASKASLAAWGIVGGKGSSFICTPSASRVIVLTNHDDVIMVVMMMMTMMMIWWSGHHNTLAILGTQHHFSAESLPVERSCLPSPSLW